MLFSGAMRFISRRIQKTGRLVGQLDSHNPALAKGIAVAKFGGAFQGFIDGDHLASHGRNKVAGGLHRLNRAEFLVFSKLVAHGGQFYVGDVAKRFLSKAGDADYGLVADLYSALPELKDELAKIGR